MDVLKLKRTSVKPVSGIYFLFSYNDLIYIGKSLDIHRRIQEHKSDKVFTSFSFVECKPEKLDRLENFLIKKYNPKLNTNLKESTSKVPDDLQTEEFKNFYSTIEPLSAKIFNQYFVVNLDKEMAFSKVKSKKLKGGYTKYLFTDIKSEINSNGSVMLSRAKGWFKWKNKTYYFEPSMFGFNITKG